MSEETWKRVPGYSRYEVSDHGRVRSLRRVITRIDGVVQARKATMLKGQASRRYLKVTLAGKWQVTVHRLVLLVFRGPCPIGKETRHLNGDPHDNRLINLEYGTGKENAADREKHGNVLRGEANRSSVLREQQVRKIRNDPQAHRAIAQQYGVSKSTVTRIKTGQTWGHLW